MPISQISRMWANQPSIVSIVTTDTLAQMTAPGYLTSQAAAIFAINHGPFQWQAGDVALISYATGNGFFGIDPFVNFTFTELSTPITGSISLTSAQILAMSATPVQIIPAAGPHTWIVLNTPIAFEYDFFTAAYAGGGAIGLEYGNTALLAGTPASTTFAAATFNGFAANNGFTLNAAATGTMASMVNLGIYLSNATAAFTTGAGILTVNFSYNVYTTSA